MYIYIYIEGRNKKEVVNGRDVHGKQEEAHAKMNVFSKQLGTCGNEIIKVDHENNSIGASIKKSVAYYFTNKFFQGFE